MGHLKGQKNYAINLIFFLKQKLKKKKRKEFHWPSWVAPWENKESNACIGS